MLRAALMKPTWHTSDEPRAVLMRSALLGIGQTIENYPENLRALDSR